MIQIVTGSNERYMPKMEPYLRTLDANSRAENCLVCVDCEPPAWLDGLKVQTVRAGRDLLVGSPEGTESLQHGAWLDCLPAAGDDDVVIWTDGDLFMQRPFTEGEWNDLENWPESAAGVSYNMGEWETLLDEAVFKLLPKTTPGAFLDHWGTATMQRPCFNIGVIVARRSLFRRLYDAYMPLWEDISRLLEHQARQQWLVSWLLHELGVNIRILPYTFHLHAHSNLPQGTLVARDGTAYFQNTMVLFFHLPMWRRQ